MPNSHNPERNRRRNVLHTCLRLRRTLIRHRRLVALRCRHLVAKDLQETDVVPKRTITSPYPQPTSRRVSDESNPNRAHIDTARIAETMRMAFGNEAVADAVQPKKGTVSAVYEHSDEEPDEDYNEPSTQRRGVDRFLLVAILAVVIAVAAIAFGFWREARERQAEAEMLQMEQFDTRFE